MKTVVKKRKARLVLTSVQRVPSKRGGGDHCDFVGSRAATLNTKAASDTAGANELPIAGGKSKRSSIVDVTTDSELNCDAAGVIRSDNDCKFASRKNKSVKGGLAIATECENADHAETNGHANGFMKSKRILHGQAGGEVASVNDCTVAASKNKGAKAETAYATDALFGSLPKHAAGGERNDAEHVRACRAIQELQRHRQAAIKMQVAGENRIVNHVATLLGYRAGLDEADRKKRFVESRKLIKAIVAGENLNGHTAIASAVRPLVLAAEAGTRLVIETREAYEKQMEAIAKTLPVLPWVKSVRGFGVLNLAIVVGEAGDLSNYANPAKLWRRLGCAPFNGAMGSTHRMKGSLSKEEWSEFGYSPRRRSQMHLLALNMVMNNDGEYRKRYDEARAKAKETHPDWKDGHLHAHGMLLALKRVLRDLWRQWRG